MCVETEQGRRKRGICMVGRILLRERLIPYGSERCISNGVFGVRLLCLFLFVFEAYGSSSMHYSAYLTVDTDQDTVFDGSVHGFTFDVKRLELRHINMAQMSLPHL